MKIKNVIANTASVMAIAAGATAANAQTAVLPYTPSLSLLYSSQKDTWNTLLLVSGIVFVVGLADSDSTLEVLGGAGILLSLYETSSTRFKFSRSYRELDLASAGKFSFGFSSIAKGEFGSFEPIRPCVSYAVRF